MNRWEGYQTGINLGGWISQVYKASKEHFDTFIKEDDIRLIASWGMDHVRLPFDYTILEDDLNPFHYKEEGLAYMDRCIEWCRANNLNIILDLHRTAGYSFYTLQENQLFESELLQKRFISLWQMLAERYKEYGRDVAFELLNEIVEPNSIRWNTLSRKAAESIREIDKDRFIVIGGNQYNSITTLKELDFLEEDHIIYTFHFYEPHIFTHQRASWEPLIKNLDFTVPYPSDTETYRKYMEQSEDFRKQYYFEEDMNKDYLRKLLKPAHDFIKERKIPLYCGEYGVIEQAPLDSNLRWHKDLSDLLIEYNIGRAVWNYKWMSFPMVNKASAIRDEKLIQIISQK